MMQEDPETHISIAETAPEPEPALDAAPQAELEPEPGMDAAAVPHPAAVPAQDFSAELDSPLEAKDVDFDVDFDDSDLGPSLAGVTMHHIPAPVSIGLNRRRQLVVVFCVDGRLLWNQRQRRQIASDRCKLLR